MNKKLTILCASAAILFSSCWHPPFDPLVSASEFTADKLGDPVWSTTVTLWDEAEGGYYLPSRDPTEYYTGAWIRKMNGTVNIGQLTAPSGGMVQFNPNRFNDTNTFGSSTVLVNPPGPNTTGYVFYCIANPSRVTKLYNNDSSSYSWTPPSFPIVGIGVRPSSSAEDILYLAEWNSTNIVLNYFSTTNTPTTIIPTPINFSIASPLPIGPAFFTESPVIPGHYYLSGSMANGKIETYVWFNILIAPTLLLPINRQLTGILSDGRLLADTGDRLYVYSADGTDSFMIPTGLLRFVHERTDGTVWYSVFTRTVMIPGGKSDDGSEYLIEIYEIPTADLSDLAE